ncbi:MAG: dihydroneopterin aldolase [Candidatus Omnitrophica bacterium]|nr:dihydroneopterin aldolase [Candidatus Omnitrophota bacterium]
MDSILIEGLECFAHVGVPRRERQKRQKVLIDLELGLDLKKAIRRDEVEDTLDYAAAAAQVKRLVETRSFRLVEAMAGSVSEGILRRFKVKRVRVRIRKFSVPGARSVGVEMIRGRKA